MDVGAAKGVELLSASLVGSAAVDETASNEQAETTATNVRKIRRLMDMSIITNRKRGDEIMRWMVVYCEARAACRC